MWVVPKNVIPGGQQIVGFNQLGKNRGSSCEDRYFQVIRKKKVEKKKSESPAFVSLPTRENSPRAVGMGYPGFQRLW